MPWQSKSAPRHASMEMPPCACIETPPSSGISMCFLSVMQCHTCHNTNRGQREEEAPRRHLTFKYSRLREERPQVPVKAQKPNLHEVEDNACSNQAVYHPDDHPVPNRMSTQTMNLGNLHLTSKLLRIFLTLLVCVVRTDAGSIFSRIVPPAPSD